MIGNFISYKWGIWGRPLFVMNGTVSSAKMKLVIRLSLKNNWNNTIYLFIFFCFHLALCVVNLQLQFSNFCSGLLKFFWYVVLLQVEGLMRLMEGEHVGPFNLGNPGEFTMLELAGVSLLLFWNSNLLKLREGEKQQQRFLFHAFAFL